MKCLNHISQSPESISIPNISTLEGLLLTPGCNPWGGAGVQNIEHPHTLEIFSSFFFRQMHFSFIGKARFMLATLSSDICYCRKLPLRLDLQSIFKIKFCLDKAET